jgi:hypothetical protein
LLLASVAGGQFGGSAGGLVQNAASSRQAAGITCY